MLKQRKHNKMSICFLHPTYVGDGCLDIIRGQFHIIGLVLGDKNIRLVLS